MGSNPVPIETFGKYGHIDHLWVINQPTKKLVKVLKNISYTNHKISNGSLFRQTCCLKGAAITPVAPITHGATCC